MPQATGERVAQIRRWKGLNLRDIALAIDENELSDAVNVNLTDDGALVKRTGWVTKHDGTTLGANQVRVLGFFKTDTYAQFIARSGTNLYTSTDAITWTVIAGGPWGNVEHGVQYTDKFYMVRRDNTIVQWDGATASAITGSPMGSHCVVFKDRLFVVNTFGVGSAASRIYFSDPFDFSSTGWPATNYVGVGEGNGDILVACQNVQDYLVVFKSGGSWNLFVQGVDTEAWILRPFYPELGCVSKNSIAVWEGVIYFLSHRGVYQTDGNTARNISVPISPLFNGIVIASTTINAHSSFLWEDKYVLVLETYATPPTWGGWSTDTWGSLSTTPWSGSGAAHTWIVYNIRQKGWTKWSPIAGLSPHTFVTISLSATLRGVYGGSRNADGKVFKFGESRYQDDATSYEVIIDTKEIDLDTPTEKKRGKWIGMELKGAGPFRLWHIVDGDSSASIVGTAEVALEEYKMKGPGYFRSWRPRLTSTHDQAMTVYGFALHVSPARHIKESA